MASKLITCDLYNQAFSKRIYDTLNKIGDTAKLSDGSFVVDTPLSTREVLTKLLKVIDLDDRIYVLELSHAWSGYGEIKVNAFLEGHL